MRRDGALCAPPICSGLTVPGHNSAGEWTAHRPPRGPYLAIRREIHRVVQLPILQAIQPMKKHRVRLPKRLLKRRAVQRLMRLAIQVTTQVATHVQTHVPTQATTRLRTGLSSLPVEHPGVLRGDRLHLRHVHATAFLRRLPRGTGIRAGAGVRTGLRLG